MHASSHLIPPVVYFLSHFLSNSQKYPEVSRRKQKHLIVSAEHKGWRVDTPAALPQRFQEPWAPDTGQTEGTFHPGVVSLSPTQSLPSGQVAHKGPRPPEAIFHLPSHSLSSSQVLLKRDNQRPQFLPRVCVHGARSCFPPGITCQETTPPTPHRCSGETKAKDLASVFLFFTPAYLSRTETTFRNAYDKIKIRERSRQNRKIRGKT